MKGTPPLKKCLQTLYQTLVSKTDAEGRSVAEMFRRKPSAKMYPEYYIVVSRPIDLKEISAKIKSEQVRLRLSHTNSNVLSYCSIVILMQ